jgi:hypothetical protein
MQDEQQQQFEDALEYEDADEEETQEPINNNNEGSMEVEYDNDQSSSTVVN